MIEKEIVNTPLKIQGKKTKLIPNIIGLANEIIENNNNIHTWIEPFLGSGIVAFNCPKQIKQVICGDINPHVIRLYEMLRDNNDLPGYARERLLCMSDLLKERGEEYYLSIRNSFNKDKEIINFLFLSRTCFNGMMRFNKKGEWNLPFCKNNDKLSLTIGGGRRNVYHRQIRCITKDNERKGISVLLSILRRNIKVC